MSYDAIIVGASFAGLAATMQLARARRRVLVIDAGAPRNRFTDASHGFLGQDGRPPLEILADGRRELERYPSVSFASGQAVSAEANGAAFTVTLADERKVAGARLILATGVRDDLPKIAGLSERWGRSVLHCPYCHGYEVADRTLGVLATGPISLHQALLVADWGPTTLFTQDVLVPDRDALTQLAARGVKIERSPVIALKGTTPALDAVELDDGRTVPLDALFVAPATQMASDLAAQLGCAFSDGPTGPIVHVGEDKLTSVMGIYAAGDAASPMWNATLAAAAGVTAGMSAHQSLVFQ